MATSRVAGITVARTYKGSPLSITFNYKKYGDLLRTMFFEKGLEYPVEDVPNARVEKAIKEAMNHKKLKSYDSVQSMLADCLK